MSLPIISIVAINDFAPFQLSVPCAIFGQLPYEQAHFDLRICACEPGALHSHFGFNIETQYGLADLAQSDIIIIPYWRSIEEKPGQELLDALVEAHQNGVLIVGLCLGTCVLAYAGLLANRRSSLHWQLESEFVKRFDNINPEPNVLYIEDDGILTSAGVGASIDCCLYLVRKLYGDTEAMNRSNKLVLPTFREGQREQFIDRPINQSNSEKRLNELLETIKKDLTQDYDLDSLAERIQMNRRTFTRHFKKCTGTSLGQWLLEQRLQRSLCMLENSTHSIERIAEMVGFKAASSYRSHFKTQYQITPREWRQNYRKASV